MVLEDNQKIGFGLICLGLGFVMLGVVLLFDASLIGNEVSSFFNCSSIRITITNTYIIFVPQILYASNWKFSVHHRPVLYYRH